MSNFSAMGIEMGWTFRRLADGGLEVRDGNRVRSIIDRDRAGYRVTRIGSNGRSHGCDGFRTLAEAKAWATSERIFRAYTEERHND